MSMKVITLEGLGGPDAVEILQANSITAAQINIQNRTGGPLYLWIDGTAPTEQQAGLLIKSGDIFSFTRGTNVKVYAEGKGTVVLQY